MAGLIFLFSNVPNAPSVNVDYGLRPDIVDVLDEIPYLEIDLTTATFTDTDTTYNDSSVTYNDANQVYGGYDPRNDLPPKFDTIEDVKPDLDTVGFL